MCYNAGKPMGDPVAGPEKQDVEESATHLFRVESSTPSRIDAFAIPIVYTASQLLQGSIAVPSSISRPLALLQSRIHLTSGIRKVQSSRTAAHHLAFILKGWRCSYRSGGPVVFSESLTARVRKREKELSPVLRLHMLFQEDGIPG